jgi:rfaE bifunctional protein kinase chain/domain/rfaE bifunctional protein nucleotidyltransferase chain/domain
MLPGNKIHPLEQLPAKLAALRQEGKRIVHCHGVFDLLHIGHIWHFQEAKKLGDVLVVTVTPDQFVNKGPHRPAFPDAVRAEAVAALDCVDLVAVNHWPTSVETIALLRPDLYVKGSEYRDAEKDLTGAITAEKEAVEAIGGKLAFTHEKTFSSSGLLNEYMPILSPESREFLAELADRYTSDEILGVLERLKSIDALVVGEAIIDEYQYCHAIGKSSKSPTLVVQAENEERFAGGALAIANNVAAFCRSVTLLTQLGADDSQEEFIRSRLRPNVEPVFLYRRSSPTIVKRRFVESYFFAKMFEVYKINDGLLDPRDNEALCTQLNKQAARHDLTIVADFGHSMVTPEVVNLLCSQSRFLAVNTQSNAGSRGYHRISKYPRADYLCVAEDEMRMEAGDMQGDLHGIVHNVVEGADYKTVVTTCGNRGAICVSRDAEMVHVPALATKVTDRIGAGDAFFSLTAPCVHSGAPLEIVGFLGNVAGAEAVATVGHRTYLDPTSLARHIQVLFL